MAYRKRALTALILLSFLLYCGLPQLQAQSLSSLKGAWVLTNNNSPVKKSVIATDNYFMQAIYDTVQNKFIASSGGHYTISHDTLTVTLDFHSNDSKLVGKSYVFPIENKGSTLAMTNEFGHEEIWRRTDNGIGKLAGCWRITQRQQNNEMQALPDGDRKTLKILSGKNFQWAAFNTATGEFSGCGGGTYSFENGKYTEHIDFFSRDSSRVGMSLTFEGKVADSLWYHKGKSTKGAPVFEIWKLQ